MVTAHTHREVGPAGEEWGSSNMVGMTLRRAVLVIGLMVCGAMQLTGCGDDDALISQRKGVVTAVTDAFSSSVPACSLANRDLWLSPGAVFEPEWWPESWAWITARLVPGTPRSWDVTLEAWCRGELRTEATARLAVTVRAHVVVDNNAFRVASWTEVSSATRSPLSQLGWLVATVVICMTFAGVLVLGGAFWLASLGELFAQLAWFLLVPVSVIVTVAVLGYSGYLVFHSVAGVALTFLLAVHASGALLLRIKAYQEHGVWFDDDEHAWHRRIARTILLALAVFGVYVMGLTAGSAVGAMLAAGTCGIMGLAWGPLCFGGGRNSASVGAAMGIVVGAISGAQDAAPEWWMLAIVGGSIFGHWLDRSER